MNKLLHRDWWAENPIDFEHKKWLFLAYLRILDENFTNLVFSPYLLHSEGLIKDMKSSKNTIIESKNLLKKEKYEILQGILVKKTIFREFPNKMGVFLDILDYSIPLLEKKVDFGNELWQNNKSILW